MVNVHTQLQVKCFVLVLSDDVTLNTIEVASYGHYPLSISNVRAVEHRPKHKHVCPCRLYPQPESLVLSKPILSKKAILTVAQTTDFIQSATLSSRKVPKYTPDPSVDTVYKRPRSATRSTNRIDRQASTSEVLRKIKFSIKAKWM